jgi:hypothetical protein
MKTALLVGKEPDRSLEFQYTREGDFDAVVIGSLGFGELLYFQQEQVLGALAAGKPVYLYTPGLPEATGNRALAASLSAGQRQLKNWGVIFTDGGRKKLITAEEARALRLSGQRPGAGAVMTPLAREILEGMD